MNDIWSKKENVYIRSLVKKAEGEGENRVVMVYYKISGQIVIDTIVVKYSMNQQAISAKYHYRGNMTIISPKTGKPLGIIRKRRRKSTERREDKQCKVPVAQKNLLCNSEDDTSIKAFLESEAKKLVAKHAFSIDIELGMTRIMNLDSASLAELKVRYGEEFLRSCGTAESTAKEYRSTLNKAVSAFAITPVSRIDEKAIHKIQRNKGTQLTDRELHLLSRFWIFLIEKHGLSIDNPIAQYLEGRPKAKDGKKNAKKHGTRTWLTAEEEHLLNTQLDQLISEDIRYLIIILALHVGLNNEQIRMLQWQDILFDPDDPDYVRIRITRSLATATSDYTRPVFLFAAAALRKIHDTVVAQYPDSDIGDQYVINANGKPLSQKEVTDFIRKVLLVHNVNNTIYYAAKEENKRSAAGITLLLNTYKYKVSELCGLQNDPAAIKYLCALSLSTDVTADHYRSFSCPEGQRKLYIAMRRVGTGLKPPATSKATVTRIPVDGGYLIRIVPDDPSKIVTASFDCKVASGDSIVLDGKFGVVGKVTPASISDGADIPQVHYYECQRDIDASAIESTSSASSTEARDGMFCPEYPSAESESVIADTSDSSGADITTAPSSSTRKKKHTKKAQAKEIAEQLSLFDF